MTKQQPLIGTLVADRYRIDAKIGEGGMGTVYRAEHVAMKKPVAIKVLHGAMTKMTEAVKRFEREAIAAGRIDHPNVVGATDFGQLPDGSFFLVLEYIAGSTLVQLLKREGALPVKRALGIARQIASALQAAHGHGIVHRDLKPDNVMLVPQSGGKELVKVLDFGIAKLEVADETQLTQMGSVFGTPQYMSPEQAAGTEVDQRVDLYALGVILYEMLSGAPPFKHERMAVLLAKHLTEEPAPLPAHLPAHLRRLTDSLLKKAPQDRPQTALEVYERLRAAPPKSTMIDVTSALVSKKLSETATAIVAANKRLREHVTPTLRRAAIAAHQTRIRGVPVWTVGGGALVLLLGATVLLGNDTADPSTAPVHKKQTATAKRTPKRPTPPVKKPPATPKNLDAKRTQNLDPELKRVLSLAKRGSQPAVYALEQRDPDDRSPDEWLALAIGRLRLGKVKLALEASEEAIDEEPEIAADEMLLGGLRYFGGLDGAANEEVLGFAAEQLGSHGADLLFNVWSSTSRKTPATEKAWELLDSSDVQDEMSPALKLALEIRAAESCEDQKELMPRLKEFGDERSMIPMRKMAKTRGCGKDEKEDCFPCLREDTEFKDALTQVAMRNAPRYNWRR